VRRLFKSIEYLKTGNERQRRAYKAINELGIFKEMSRYNPVLCGTIPIEIDIVGSDLDIIMNVNDFKQFYREALHLYGNHIGFQMKEKIIRDTSTIKVNFDYGGFNFELFGQPKAVDVQPAYQHMLVEHHLLMKYPYMKDDIIRLKEQGIKTEPAFAQILQLEGDPYDELLILGRKMGVLKYGD
jgi:hypothetical protein